MSDPRGIPNMMRRRSVIYTLHQFHDEYLMKLCHIPFRCLWAWSPCSSYILFLEDALRDNSLHLRSPRGHDRRISWWAVWFPASRLYLPMQKYCGGFASAVLALLLHILGRWAQLGGGIWGERCLDGHRGRISWGCQRVERLKENKWHTTRSQGSDVPFPVFREPWGSSVPSRVSLKTMLTPFRRRRRSTSIRNFSGYVSARSKLFAWTMVMLLDCNNETRVK